VDFVENLIFFPVSNGCRNWLTSDKDITDYVTSCFLWTTVYLQIYYKHNILVRGAIKKFSA